MILESITIGLHLISTHIPNNELTNNQNWGIYAKTEEGWMAGGYRNTLDRNSFYVAKAFEKNGFGLILGAVSGYQTKTIQLPPTGPNGQCKGGGYAPCYLEQGHTRGAIGPMLAVSYVAPEVMGVAPRLTISPGWGGDRTVLHLSVEHKF